MPVNAPECSVIIPVFNKWDLTRNCLESLREHSAGHDLEVIVADNGSADATATDLAPLGQSLFGERFRAIVFPANKNFGPACNAGARAAQSSLLFFLNNDTVLTPGWLPPLLAAMRRDKAPGAVGPLLLYADDTVQHLGVAYGTRGPLHVYQGFPRDHPVVFNNRELQAITAAALMIRADFFLECGEFHEAYRNGFEDLDLCAQIRRRGKTLRCVPDSVIFHLESQTPGRGEGDGENAAIFTRRCGKDVFIDVHHHALRDGFFPFISDLLTVGIKLKDKDEAALSCEASGKDAETWLRLVRKNPLWVRGREVLAQSLEQAGRQAEAVEFRVQLVEIEPMLERYRDLLRLAPLAGTADWPKTVARHFEILQRYRTDKPLVVSTLKGIRQRFRKEGDPFLEQAFTTKLRELFPENDGQSHRDTFTEADG